MCVCCIEQDRITTPMVGLVCTHHGIIRNYWLQVIFRHTAVCKTNVKSIRMKTVRYTTTSAVICDCPREKVPTVGKIDFRTTALTVRFHEKFVF